MLGEAMAKDQLPPRSLYSPLLEAAARLAARGHYRQFRKHSRSDVDCGDSASPLPEECVPYVTHLTATACILARLGASDSVIAAALLHDYLEDVPSANAMDKVRAAVGPAVLDLVIAVTEDKRRHLAAAETWDERKRQQVGHVARMPYDAVLIKAADALHNLLSLIVDLEAAADPAEVWGRFNAEADQQLRYLADLTAALRGRLGDHPLTLELETHLPRLEQLAGQR